MNRFVLPLFVVACANPSATAPEARDPSRGTTCPPEMSVFPVAGEHNIGYDHASCGTGTCDISCPDWNANSDWGGAHHGIDVFAWHRAPMVSVADTTVVAVGVVSSTSGLRVRLRDGCGWEYYYGHLDEAVVSVGQTLQAGDLIGYMGATGTASTHLHFNVSPDGDYSNDIDPFDLLNGTSPTACGAAPDPGTEPAPAGPTGCGIAEGDTVLAPNTSIESCDGRFSLWMQDDGNLVLYQTGWIPLWSSGTQGNPGSSAVMQGDGNLVVYNPWGTALWHTHTHGNPGSVLAVQGDGNLVIYDGARAIWNSGTCCH